MLTTNWPDLGMGSGGMGGSESSPSHNPMGPQNSLEGVLALPQPGLIFSVSLFHYHPSQPFPRVSRVIDFQACIVYSIISLAPNFQMFFYTEF